MVINITLWKPTEMKNIILLCALLYMTLLTQAQSVFFNEDFDHYQGLNIGGGWYTSEYSGAVGWRTSDMYNLYCADSKVPIQNHFDKVAAISDCHNPRFSPRNNSNVLMFTPTIDLSAANTGVVLKFDSYFNKRSDINNYTEVATIEVSTNGGATWTIIKNVEPGLSDDTMYARYINLSAYKGFSNVHVGFRYRDLGGDHQLGGWTVDNIKVYEPADKDLGLIAFSPLEKLSSYAIINSTYTHTGTVFNFGTDTAFGYTINYQRKNGPVLSHQVAIPLPPLSAYDFTHSVPDTVFNTGVTEVKAWVELAGDKVADNDTADVTIRGAYFMPQKVVVLEEGTGNWHGYAPQGMVLKNILESDSRTNMISIHTGDPMENKKYDDYIYSLNQFYTAQYYLLDRRLNADPSSVIKLTNSYNRQFGFADIALYGEVYGTELWVTATVKPAIDLQGDYRLAMVITENNVSGTDSSWNQRNFFAGGTLGPMGGFESRPDTILGKDIEYDYVAREIIPSAEGLPFKTAMLYGQTYTHKFHAVLDSDWDKNNLRAIVMLINNDDTTILNSNRLDYFLNIAEPEVKRQLFSLYPNPANGYTNVVFDASEAEEHANIFITDISGRVTKEIVTKNLRTGKNTLQIPTNELNNGIYFITLSYGTESSTIKMIVSH